MIGQASFELGFEIIPSPIVVAEFLCDLPSDLPLYSLIESIREVGALDDMPRSQRYEVPDRIPFGPTSFRVTYLTAIEQISESEVHAYARLNPKGGFNPFAESRKFQRAPTCTNRFRLMPHGIRCVTSLKRPRVLTRERRRSCISLEATRESGGPPE